MDQFISQPYSAIDEPVLIEGQVPLGGHDGDPSVTVRFYTPDGVKIGQESTNQYACKILPGSTWTLDEKGSLDARVILAGHEHRETVTHRDVMAIYLNNSNVPIFFGHVVSRTMPIDTGDSTTIRAHGFASQLKWGVINGYTSDSYSLDSFVDIVAGVIDANTDLIINPSQILDSETELAAGFTASATTYEDTLSQLAALASADDGSPWTYGVNKKGELYFMPSSNVPQYNDTLRWGVHFTEVSAEEDSTSIVNNVWVRIHNDPTPPHPTVPRGLWSTPHNDTTSINLYRTRAAVYTAPSSLNYVSAIDAGEQFLANDLTPRQKVAIRDAQFFGKQITTPGSVKIIGRSGESLELKKKRVQYTMDTNGGLNLSIQLGHTNGTIVEALAGLASRQARGELAYRAAITSTT